MQRAACDRQHRAAPPRRPGNCPTDRDRRQYALDTRKCRTLPGLEEFRPLFSEQERAAEDEDWERADACNIRIRNALALTFPDGGSGSGCGEAKSMTQLPASSRRTLHMSGTGSQKYSSSVRPSIRGCRWTSQ